MNVDESAFVAMVVFLHMLLMTSLMVVVKPGSCDDVDVLMSLVFLLLSLLVFIMAFMLLLLYMLVFLLVSSALFFITCF